MLSTDAPRNNHLLAALPADEYERLSPHLEQVQLRLGEILHESGDQLQYVYFPTTAIVSLAYIMADGASAEIASVGNEGMLGVALIMGGNSMPNRAVVLCAGSAYRLTSRLLMNEINRAGDRRPSVMQHVLLRYIQALITQMSQNAVCNRHHSIEQQLCRWLLSCLDHSASNELTLTQELLASVLGVRREGITEAAGKLQRAGLIHYRRGHITVLDRTGLERQACECYQTVKTEFDRLLHYKTATQTVDPVARYSTATLAQLPTRAHAAQMPRQTDRQDKTRQDKTSDCVLMRDRLNWVSRSAICHANAAATATKPSRAPTMSQPGQAAMPRV